MFDFLKLKGEERYDGESDGFLNTFLTVLKKAIGGLFCKSSMHYDLDVDEKAKIEPYRAKRTICNLIFVIYGFFSGMIGQQYAEYECRSFQSFACGMSLTSPDLYSTPLTILMNIVIIFAVYLSIAVLLGGVYFGLKSIWFKNAGEEEIEMLQIALMYGLLINIFTSLVFFALPFNAFIFMHR